MSYQVILFDADDTLFDYAKSELHALEHAFIEMGMECNSAYVESYRVINQQLWREFETGLIKLDLLRTERFRRLFTVHQPDITIDAEQFSHTYLKYLGEGSFVLDGAVSVCSYLLANGYRIAVITNGIKVVQFERINRSELSNSFEQIIVSEDAGFQKPNKGIFDYAFNKLNIQDKSSVLIVGDSLSSDIQGGINYGIDTCWFNPHRKINASGIQSTYEIHKLEELLAILGEDYHLAGGKKSTP
ncbi:YjjG family noncanonical pyrimidine nucleotidase [Paenibacillus abyssi]|uniref:Noncanonical pyrimidine nucleotidase, YjjG family protein n=1 Tax=Paenibacillus abyssi TaxID=1340531 RepID=A0A917FY47_9BACL|nr:YjjG family noncanonical pyrimidine nucleotidase [Paenibacillus abyssi]GGG13795.1 noncanonical pyrimidine nucleotidase, YjjG family protein [Paenibacillus abyssi]